MNEKLKNSIFFQLLGYCSYIFFLHISGWLSITLALVPLIFFYFNLSLRSKILVLFFAFLFDYQYSFLTENDREEKYNVIDFFVQKTGQSEYALHAPLIAIGFLLTFYLLASALHKLRKIRTYLVIPFYILITFAIAELMVFSSNQNNLFGLYISGIIGILTKKKWLIFLLALELQARKLRPLEALGGVIIQGPFFRESLSLDNFQSEKVSQFWRGVGISALISFFYLLYYQIQYQIYGIDSPTVLKNNYSMHLACPINFHQPVSLQISFVEFSLCLTGDFFRHTLLRLFLESMILVIPGMMMGFHFPAPYSNFMTAKSWTSFLFKTMHYYSLILFKIFVLEFYNFFFTVRKKKSRELLALSTFMGIVVGGYCYHLSRDYMVPFVRGPDFFQENLFFPPKIFYFSLIGLLCAASALKKSSSSRNYFWLWPMFYLLLYALVRSPYFYSFLNALFKNI